MKLPPLPKPNDADFTDWFFQYFTDEHMQDYGEACYLAGAEQMRERAAELAYSLLGEESDFVAEKIRALPLDDDV